MWHLLNNNQAVNLKQIQAIQASDLDGLWIEYVLGPHGKLYENFPDKKARDKVLLRLLERILNDVN